MFDPTHLFVFFCLGACVSYLVGSVGASSGTLYIPILFIALPMVYPPSREQLVPMVIATATACTIFSAIASASMSFFARQVDTLTIASKWPYLVLGGMLGAFGAYGLQSYASVFKALFAIVLLVNAWVVWSHFEPPEELEPVSQNAFGAHWYTAMAFISTGFGAGGQAYILFLMKKLHQSGRTAIGTARSMNLISTAAALVPYLYWSYYMPNVDNVTEGYFYLPAMAMFILTTFPFIYLGSLASRHLPIMTFKRTYAVFIALTGVWSLIYAMYLV